MNQRLEPAPSARELEIARLERLAYWLDDGIPLPGTKRRVGFDGVIGLIPVVGDFASALVSIAMIARLARLGVGWAALSRMAANLALDWGLGSVPLVGDIWDFGFKSNQRNLAVARRAFAAKARAPEARPEAPVSDPPSEY